MATARATGTRQSATGLAGEAARAELFGLVLTAGPISRTRLAKRLGLSPSTVTRMLPPLLDAGYLREEGARATGPGRPQRLLSVNPERHLVAGVKLTPTHVAAVVTDMGAQVLARAACPVADHTGPTVLSTAARVVRDLLADVPDAAGRTLGVGVGMSGHVDTAQGVCRYSGLLGWYEVPVAAPLAEATGLPTTVANDANALAVAERWFGGGRDVDTFAVVTVGPGIGCGLLLDGALFTGATGIAAEFGHIPVDPAGPVCGCGRRGCLESLASTCAVLARLRQAGVDCQDLAQAVRLARDGRGPDARAARAAFAAAGDALGRGLATLCNLLNPARIILAGEGVAAYDLLRPAMDDALAYHAFSTAAHDCEVSCDPVTDDLWARGAACLVIRDTVRAPFS
ncbi:ROK family transcriptional regulator [Streptomyces sp. ICBB 8177]|uniref:ROK family transcriptional regulator n=1 Tax=Streptomyces sp. ICBB 8177 TaxID=563922 RepID=UPI000D67F019|nr:ROK family transcriptional regulator [Streptomyces sp. ICBB 8177]PWI45720.1 sugar kinase [Streptomyces sp. ICBB 8177]